MNDTLYPTDEVLSGDLSEHQILEKYAYLVKRAIKHLKAQVSATFDQDDFYQIGMMGLIEAARRYEKIDERFASFAFHRIRGAILDALRKQDWRPRPLRQAAHQLAKKERELSKKLGREPTQTEISEFVGISLEKVRELQEASSQVDSFDDWLSGSLSGKDESEAANLQIAMAQVLETISERERLIVHLYYYEDLNMKEIALALDLTEPRVSQIHKGILKTIKEKLQR